MRDESGHQHFVIRKRYLIAGIVLAFLIATSAAFAQPRASGSVGFSVTIPDTVGTQTIPGKTSAARNDVSGFETALSTSIYERVLERVPAPQSVLTMPGSGVVPNNPFLAETLIDFGFDRSEFTSSFFLIDNLTPHFTESYSRDDILAFLALQPEGTIFIVGLDFHAGFISVEESGIYFVHSDYGTQDGLIREPVKTSLALKDSGIFVLGDITDTASPFAGWPNG